MTVAADRTVRFAYRAADEHGGGDFVPFGESFLASSSRWVGAKVGVFASSPAGTARAGLADFTRFVVTE